MRKWKSCVATVVVLAATASLRADDWPQWRGVHRDGVWSETGVVDHFASDRLTPQWRVEIGSGYSGPTVADGRVYVTDRVTQPKQIERVHCFDEKTGKKIWSHEYGCIYSNVSYEAGPRAAVTVYDGRAYALGTMGNFFCFDAATGKIHWQKDLRKDYKVRMPIWGLASAPLIEGDLVILQVGGEGDADVVAFNRVTGKELWRALPDEPSYSAPIVIEQGGKRVLVQYTGRCVVGLDPKNGKVYWSVPFPPRQMVIGIATPVHHDDMLFLTNFFDGSLMLSLDPDKPAAKELWRRAGASEQETDALHSIISTPIMRGGYVYGVDSYGELRCLDAKTGDRIWEDQTAVPRNRWATIHFIERGAASDRVWMFNDVGELIIAKLSPKGFEEISRAKLIEPTHDQLPSRRGGVTWAHPAFANRHVFARSDKELLCVDLSAK